MISFFKLGGSKKPKAPAPVIWINGYPGVGRQGVAVELTRLFPKGTVEVVYDINSCALADVYDEEHNDDCRSARSATNTDYVVCDDEAHKTIIIVGASSFPLPHFPSFPLPGSFVSYISDTLKALQGCTAA